ncbi:MAG: DUF2974 domain-containing protein [Clostridia bacterium]|nr:DUF2974 domain-containing protein [Clostridia bacterium]
MYLVDYVGEMRDVPAVKAPLGEADMLLFAVLPYLHTEGLVPESFGTGIAFPELAARYAERSANGKTPSGLIIPDAYGKAFSLAAHTRRYADLTVCGYVSEIVPEEEKQFTALTIVSKDGELFVSFAGTDDTVLGWKEDCRLVADGTMPAQEHAVRYLNGALSAFDGRFSTMGTSKGGHLAVWAAAGCRAPERLNGAFDFDGPGFSRAFLDGEAFRAVSDRCLLIAARYAAISRILDNVPNVAVTRATKRGAYQHDCSCWVIENGAFVREPGFMPGSDAFHGAFEEMMERTTPEQRREATQTLFGLLEQTGAETLTELHRGRKRYLPEIMKGIRALPQEERRNLFSIVIRLSTMFGRTVGFKR